MSAEDGFESKVESFNPPGLAPPLAQYQHVSKAGGFVFIAGQVALDENGEVVGENDFEAQCRQTYRNIEMSLQGAGVGWANVVQFTTYLVHSQDIERLWRYRNREFTRMFPDGKYPPNALLIVDRLVLEPLLVEVQAVAVQ